MFKKTEWPWVYKRVVPLAMFALILLGGARFLWLYRNTNATGAKVEPRVVVMTGIRAKVEGNKIVIPLNTIRKYELVYVECQGLSTVPLLAYVGPSDRIITAISFSEPFKGTRFHIVGGDLVSNVCGTVWNLETHQGVSGSCTEFPPQIIPNQIQNGKVLIDKDIVANWKPRPTMLNKDVTIY